MTNFDFSKVASDQSVAEFVRDFDRLFKGKLRKFYAFTRVVCLANFSKLFSNQSQLTDVAVVSGSSDEPELQLINFRSLSLLNYNAKNNTYNLDHDWQDARAETAILPNSYDLVLCNQVLEHIFSPIQGIKNCSLVTKPGGYIFISVPTIDCVHGEPHFYSSGYHPRFLARIAELQGLELIHLGAWGNRKFLSSAVLGRWLTHDHLRAGFHSLHDLKFPGYMLKDGRLNDLTGKFICASWALFRKPQQVSF